MQRVQMGFLSEEITATSPTVMSPFAECIVLATICGRALLHKHCASVEHVYGHTSQDFWDRHHWIDNILTQRITMLTMKYPPASQHIDPMLIFTEMVANTAILFLYKIIELMPCQTPTSSANVIEYKQRATKAAGEIVSITRALSLFTQAKVCLLLMLNCQGTLINSHRFTHSLQSVFIFARNFSRCIEKMLLTLSSICSFMKSWKPCEVYNP